MKDFYDIWVLMKTFALTGKDLRGLSLQPSYVAKRSSHPIFPDALTPAFSEDPAKQHQW